MGRPTSFKPEYTKQAYEYALLGLTDKQMAGLLSVTEQTFNNWKQSQDGFFESLQKGKEIADAKVSKALYKRACGFKTTEDRMVGDEVVTLTKQHPPDTAAAFIWLKNRQPLLWRDQKQIEVTQGKPEREMSLPEIDQRLSELQGKKAANG